MTGVQTAGGSIVVFVILTVASMANKFNKVRIGGVGEWINKQQFKGYMCRVQPGDDGGPPGLGQPDPRRRSSGERAAAGNEEIQA